MFCSLGALGRSLLIQRCCPLCARPIDQTLKGSTPCRPCQERLQLSPEGIKGWHPLPWQALGRYAGGFRALLLKLRREPNKRRFHALITLLDQGLQLPESAVLVPIPSWKHHHGNTVPTLMAQRLGLPSAPLLMRHQARLSQHHLSRNLRKTNLTGAFQAAPIPEKQPAQIWLVDDILTTGSTALAARDALHHAGYAVGGMICMARTPARSCRR